MTPARALALITAAAALGAAPGTAVAQELRSPASLPEVEAPAPAAAAATAAAPSAAPASDGRIFGGTRVPPGAAPWQSEIYRRISDARWAQHLRDHPQETRPRWELQHWCGGALIADDWILTAAHCLLVDPQHSDLLLKPEYTARRAEVTVSREGQVSLSRCVAAQLVIDGFRVRLGSEDIARDDGLTYRIDCAVVHPGWTPADIYHNDIGLVHFAADGAPPPRDLPGIREIRLHKGLPPPDGTAVTVMGWGKTRAVPGFAPSAVLLQTDLGVQNAGFCANRLGVTPGQVPAEVLCAGATGHKTCLGDSGGPVVFTNGKPNYLVGIVSWGRDDCASDALPGVYTRVGAYAAWIADVLEAPR